MDDFFLQDVDDPDYYHPPTAAEPEADPALRARRIAQDARIAEEARIAKETRMEKERREHLLTEKTRYCHHERFANCQLRSFFFTCECSGDTMMKDVKSEAAMTRIGEALHTEKRGVILRSVTVGVTETGGCRTIQMAIDLKSGHAVPATMVMTALHSAFLTFDGEIRFSPDDTRASFLEKARRILAPDGSEPVDVDPDPYVYHGGKRPDGDGDPVYLQLQRIQNTSNRQRGSKHINLYPTLGMEAALINAGAASGGDDAKKIIQECRGSWKKVMSTTLFSGGRRRGSRNPLLFRVCFDMLSRSPTPGETYERFVQEKVYGTSRKRPRKEREEREETAEELAAAMRKIKGSSLPQWARRRLT